LEKTKYWEELGNVKLQSAIAQEIQNFLEVAQEQRQLSEE
jgi:hypothetical protein